MSARDDYPQARDVTLRKYDFAAYQVGKALDEIDRLRARVAFQHAPDCLTRLPDFDYRDCTCSP